MYTQLGQIFDLVLDGKNDKGQTGLYLIGSETTRDGAFKRLADLRKKELPGEFYLCVPWRNPANPKRLKCYGPRAIICENCKSEMRITGGNEALKTAWCSGCGSERVFARLGGAEKEEETKMHERKTTDEYQVLGNYGQGFELVTAAATRKEANQYLKDYRKNEPGIAFKIVVKRIKKEEI